MTVASIYTPSYSMRLSLKVERGQDEIILLKAAKIVTSYSSKIGGALGTLSLIKNITFSLRRLGVKGNSGSVTEYDMFF